MKELIIKFLEEQGFFADCKNHAEPETKVKKGEKVIGEMNDLEKGLFSFIFEKNKFHDELTKKIEEACEADNNETSEKLRKEDSLICEVVELARRIMWLSINSRFENSKEATAKGIREEFKVVEICEEADPFGNAIFISGFGAIISKKK